MLYEDYINLHQIPELGFKEIKTSTYIKTRLKSLNAELISIGTGVCAFFNFNKEQTLGFRAEEDALPIKEKNSFSYVFKGNRMHACGHDSHMAMLINLAHFINTLSNYPYNILLVFQPSEETIGGAKRIIPYLKKYKFKAFIGLHVFPYLQKGKIYSSSNTIFSNSVEVDVDVYGKASHIFDYNKRNDALKKAICYIKKIEKASKNMGLMFHVGYLKSGIKRNVCPSHALIKASLRGKEDHRTEDFINKYLSINSKDIKTKCSELIPCVKNSYINQNQLFQDLRINYLESTLFLADDFSYYDQEFNTLFFLLGTESKYFLHNEKFFLDKEDLKNGYVFLLDIIDYFLYN